MNLMHFFSFLLQVRDFVLQIRNPKSLEWLMNEVWKIFHQKGIYVWYKLTASSAAATILTSFCANIWCDVVKHISCVITLLLSVADNLIRMLLWLENVSDFCSFESPWFSNEHDFTSSNSVINSMFKKKIGWKVCFQAKFKRETDFVAKIAKIQILLISLNFRAKTQFNKINCFIWRKDSNSQMFFIWSMQKLGLYFCV